jgi:NTE family protein
MRGDNRAVGGAVNAPRAMVSALLGDRRGALFQVSLGYLGMQEKATMVLLLCVGIAALLVSGCASYGVVENAPGPGFVGEQSYSVKTFMEGWRTSENALMLAFSGGGTRAAALSYGVLQELRDTPVFTEEGTIRLLDEVHTISSVSGGSFTSAYYGLHGDGIFDDYEEVFLRKNVEGSLIRRVLNPLSWFSTASRTETAVSYYDKHIFNGATYADIQKQGGPLILINASDLANGVRFSFVQEYFSLLCSDLSSFPVSRAVTASSAVPVLFKPVVAENHSDCGKEIPDWLKLAQTRAAGDIELGMLVHGVEKYFERDKYRYAHFVDGGITDNLGLRAIYDITQASGGGAMFMEKYQRQPPRRIVMIVVDASTEADNDMYTSNKTPSMKQTIGAMTDMQLHRYNAATLELLNGTINRLSQQLSTPEAPVTPYFILLNFEDIQDPKRLEYFNRIPTSFHLEDEQVDRLIEVGGELLRNNPEFRRLLSDLQADRPQINKQAPTRPAVPTAAGQPL